MDENPKSIDVPQSNSLDSEKTELSEYDKKIEEIKKKKSYELTQEEASMLMLSLIHIFKKKVANDYLTVTLLKNLSKKSELLFNILYNESKK